MADDGPRLEGRGLASVMSDIAETLAGHIKGVLEVILASRRAPDVVGVRAAAFLSVVGQHCDIDPRTRCPPRIIVPLLGALQTAPVPVGILASAPAVCAAHE